MSLGFLCGGVSSEHPEFTTEDLERETEWYKKFSNGSIEKHQVEEHITLDLINHFLFKGKAPFHSEFRVLVVGC